MAVACASNAGPGSSGTRVSELPRPTTGPYVVVAVDNHFHDIHPEDDIEVAASRPFVVKNQGRNLHNFSVAGTEISHDIRPGRLFRLAPVGDFLPPGDYTVFCRYHDSMGMNGSFTVVEG